MPATIIMQSCWLRNNLWFYIRLFSVYFGLPHSYRLVNLFRMYTNSPTYLFIWGKLMQIDWSKKPSSSLCTWNQILPLQKVERGNCVLFWYLQALSISCFAPFQAIIILVKFVIPSKQNLHLRKQKAATNLFCHIYLWGRLWWKF